MRGPPQRPRQAGAELAGPQQREKLVHIHGIHSISAQNTTATSSKATVECERKVEVVTLLTRRACGGDGGEEEKVLKIVPAARVPVTSCSVGWNSCACVQTERHTASGRTRAGTHRATTAPPLALHSLSRRSTSTLPTPLFSERVAQGKIFPSRSERESARNTTTPFFAGCVNRFFFSFSSLAFYQSIERAHTQSEMPSFPVRACRRTLRGDFLYPVFVERAIGQISCRVSLGVLINAWEDEEIAEKFFSFILKKVI